jgi:hypothetical protein
MNGAIFPLPQYASWRGVQLKEAQGQLYVYLSIMYSSLIDVMISELFEG